MSALPKLDAWMQRCIESGLVCSECGAEFVQAHDTKVACAFCWARLPLKEQQTVQKATHEEANRAAHINEARKRKAERGS